MEKDLKDLVNLKIKMDYYTAQYKEKTDELKKEMAQHKITSYEDPDKILTLTLRPNSKRVFNIEAIRQIFGTKAELCIEETVKADKFDALAKLKDKYVITENQQKECFMLDTGNGSLNWDGIEVYKKMLTKKG